VVTSCLGPSPPPFFLSPPFLLLLFFFAIFIKSLQITHYTRCSTALWSRSKISATWQWCRRWECFGVLLALMEGLAAWIDTLIILFSCMDTAKLLEEFSVERTTVFSCMYIIK
jgi:hypothetical protein